MSDPFYASNEAMERTPVSAYARMVTHRLYGCNDGRIAAIVERDISFPLYAHEDGSLHADAPEPRQRAQVVNDPIDNHSSNSGLSNIIQLFGTPSRFSEKPVFSDESRQQRTKSRLINRRIPKDASVNVPVHCSKDELLHTVKTQPFEIHRASAELRDDFEVVLKAVGVDGRVIQFASARLKADRLVALRAVQRSWHALEHVSSLLRSDKAFVLEAVAVHGMSLQFVDEKLSGDADVVKAALLENTDSFRFADPHLKNDPYLLRMIQIVKNPYDTSHHANLDRQVVLAIVRRDGLLLQHMPDAWQDNFEIVKAAMEQNELALQYASSRLRSEKAIVLPAIQRNAETYQHVQEALQNNVDFAVHALSSNLFVLKWMPESLTSSDDFLVLAAGTMWFCEPEAKLPAHARLVPQKVRLQLSQIDPRASQFYRAYASIVETKKRLNRQN
eukprot:TRINITY_DN3389_c0_g1_i3.p1 TRINITY_DN3389_c0_g1~~TRINITY_DN3389_c0_g1_i3.p1  ORF type:complete len:445 (-),score=64.77 TRINITY_DN3389_c0_g1_i3:298-1632(-)